MAVLLLRVFKIDLCVSLLSRVLYKVDDLGTDSSTSLIYSDANHADVIVVHSVLHKLVVHYAGLQLHSLIAFVVVKVLLIQFVDAVNFCPVVSFQAFWRREERRVHVHQVLGLHEREAEAVFIHAKREIVR